MAHFRFRLEPVLKQRKDREDAMLAAFGGAQRALRAARDHKASLQGTLESSLGRREALGAEPTDIRAFHVEQDFIVGTKQRIIQSDQAILRAQRSVEKAMRAYLAARRQSRAIEVLREKAQEEFKREQAKLDQRRLDDMMIMRQRFAVAAAEEESQP